MNYSVSNLKNQSFVKSLQDYIQKNKKKHKSTIYPLDSFRRNIFLPTTKSNL